MGAFDLIGGRTDLTYGLQQIGVVEVDYRTADMHTGGYVTPYVIYRQDATASVVLRFKFGGPKDLSAYGPYTDTTVTTGIGTGATITLSTPGAYRLPPMLVLAGERMSVSAWAAGGGVPTAAHLISVVLVQGE